MARRPRFHKPLTTYHVMLRGNDGQSIFFFDEDRCELCLLLQEGTERFGHSIHAFCFMDNHIHLAITVKEVAISEIMQNLAFRYTRYINKKYNRIGHLFQGRFKSVIVDDTEYLLELVRYIHLNPVDANLTDRPENYRWSSHRAYLKLDEYTWLTLSYVLYKLNSSVKEAIQSLEKFVLERICQTSTIDFESGRSYGILGEKEFVSEIIRSSEQVKHLKGPEIQLYELADIICRHYNLSVEALRLQTKNQKESKVRALLAFFVRKIDNLSLEKLAKLLDRDASSLSKLARRLENKILCTENLSNEISVLDDLICKHTQKMPECQA